MGEVTLLVTLIILFQVYFSKMSQSIFHRSSLALRSGLLRSNGGQRIFQGSFKACSTTTSESSDSKLPKENYFFNWKVMRELKRLNNIDYSKVFRVPRRGQNIVPFEYRFVTTKELNYMETGAKRKAERKVQMPPVMNPRKDTEKILDEDPAIVGYDAAKLVFTDISFGIHDRDRLIYVREPDGKLRAAKWEERDRLNQIYFPTEGRKINIPLVFTDDQVLDEALEQPNNYEHILNRTCVQFEPDHPLFIKTASRVYDKVDEMCHYEDLFSTRHYGPMIFHFVWEKKCDNFLMFLLQSRMLEAALAVVKLYGLIHPESKVAQSLKSHETDDGGESRMDAETQLEADQDFALLKQYIAQDSLFGAKLNACLENMLENIARDEETIDDLKESLTK